MGVRIVDSGKHVAHAPIDVLGALHLGDDLIEPFRTVVLEKGVLLEDGRDDVVHKKLRIELVLILVL